MTVHTRPEHFLETLYKLMKKVGIATKNQSCIVISECYIKKKSSIPHVNCTSNEQQYNIIQTYPNIAKTLAHQPTVKLVYGSP